jgi:hypothetical protein
MQETMSRALKLGVMSPLLLVGNYICVYFHPLKWLGNLPYLIIALVGNVLNAVGVFACVRQPRGPTWLMAFFLVLLQVAWLWALLAAFLAAN